MRVRCRTLSPQSMPAISTIWVRWRPIPFRLRFIHGIDMVPQQPKRFRHPIDTETTDCANERNCPRCLVCLFPIIFQGIPLKNHRPYRGKCCRAHRANSSCCDARNISHSAHLWWHRIARLVLLKTPPWRNTLSLTPTHCEIGQVSGTFFYLSYFIAARFLLRTHRE